MKLAEKMYNISDEATKQPINEEIIKRLENEAQQGYYSARFDIGELTQSDKDYLLYEGFSISREANTLSGYEYYYVRWNLNKE